MKRPQPLEDYTEEQVACGVTSGMAPSPEFITRMNLMRLARYGITIATHYSPRYVRFTSDSGATYSVSDQSCDCPAGLRGGVCRHRRAVVMAGGVQALRKALERDGNDA